MIIQIKYLFKLTPFIFSSVFTLMCSNIHAQSKITTYRPVQVINENHFYLNGGRISMVGGRSRLAFKIRLPQNTVRWYYSFTAAAGNNPTHQIQLFSKLTKLIDKSGFTALAMNQIIST
jgi:hypothetical protein